MSEDWQPIETAPRDRDVTVATATQLGLFPYPYRGRWLADLERWGQHTIPAMPVEPQPTHWTDRPITLVYGEHGKVPA